MIEQERLETLVNRFKEDQEGVYRTWFVDNEARLKAFRSIRRGTETVVSDIRAGCFPNDFKGSSLEFVLHAITEQKQVFEGAAHAFYWKPKLRIPDIYEDEHNKRAFGQFLEACLGASTEAHLLRAIATLDAQRIKGLGPAVANILYFLHPTLLPPSNTAILRGYNLLFKARGKLGSWPGYLAMRDELMAANARVAHLLSKDLGAFAGLLFDVGVGKLVVEENLHIVDEKARKRRAVTLRKRHLQVEADLRADQEHQRLQHAVLTVGRRLGYDVWAAANDHARSYDGERFSFLSLPELPPLPVGDEVRRTIRLIDVLWLESGSGRIVAAWEVEKSTSIYSGILRLTDLVLSLPCDPSPALYLVVPDAREKEVVAQLSRPSLRACDDTRVWYVLASELLDNCDAVCRFGEDHTIMRKIARCVC